MEREEDGTYWMPVNADEPYYIITRYYVSDYDKLDRDKPEQNKDGSTTLYFGPEPVAGKASQNYLHTPENKGWFSLIRLYGPEKSFFERTWQPGDFEQIKCN